MSTTPEKEKKKNQKLLKKYTADQIKMYFETKKTIPKSYRWGQWVVLFVLLADIGSFSKAAAISPAHSFWFLVGFLFLATGYVGLIKKSSRLIDICASYLYLKIFALCVLFLTPIVIFLTHFNIADVPQLLFSFLSGMNSTINGTQLENNPASIGHAVGGICGYLFFPTLVFYIFLNKQSRDWLKAKRVCRGADALTLPGELQ